MSRKATSRSEITDDTLFDGVPDWMMPSIVSFIAAYTATKPAGITIAKMPIVNSLERYLQIQLTRDSAVETWRYLERYVNTDEQQALDVVESILATTTYEDSVVSHINDILTSSGSKWIAVIHEVGHPTLEERVSSSANQAMDLALSSSNENAQKFLKLSWSQAFGRSPNSSTAYANAIKAIEAAGWPVITPHHQQATLGSMLGEIRSNPNQWTSSIVDKSSNQGVLAVKDLIQHIWDGQTDRHGTAKPTPPSQTASEQAVLAAVYLCNVFSRQLFSHA